MFVFYAILFLLFWENLIPDFRILHAALVEISFSILVVFSRLSILFLVLLFPPACLRKHFLVQTLNERRCSSPSDSDGGDITRNKCLSVTIITREEENGSSVDNNNKLVLPLTNTQPPNRLISESKEQLRRWEPFWDCAPWRAG